MLNPDVEYRCRLGIWFLADLWFDLRIVIIFFSSWPGGWLFSIVEEMAGPIEMDTTFEDAGAASSLDGISTGNVFYVFSTDSARILACKWI